MWFGKKRKIALRNRLLVGWREWCILPALGIPKLKCKIDTGARTSALHAMNIEPFEREQQSWVRFQVHPAQDDDTQTVTCEALLVDQRHITSSNGQKECRYVILTPCQIGQKTWEIELTLTNRSDMRFRMLLGRTAMKNQAVVDPGESFLQGE